jgi:hypothetical protein
MNSRTPKTKTIFCRVCHEDYSRLTNMCEAEGGSISDVLRTAVKELLSRDQGTGDEMLSYILTLTFSIETLNKDVEHLRAVTLANLQGINRRLASLTGRASVQRGPELQRGEPSARL